ncbi:aerobactin siderophore biosynthesis protein iucA [Bdellovibrio bacteriovorus]|uniref:Aerobactin siderophore biosynthesis protein iucA n=1 Tax=Bdellovibrio bacteriovorus TaxID=959 RepID=A0A150WIY9_BDEBC|nr:IucA/IucC family protein [Bdellovibrio bacteriovorus]KYG63757.1 aerobactin siderophore biosynthesis protein iucA [Bdellovibrio bacteriovorus]
MHKFKELSLMHSISCFFNALFREFHAYEIINTASLIPASQDSISVKVSEKNTLLIPLKKKSSLGRHQYLDQFYILREGQLTSLGFMDAVDLIVGFLSEVWREDPSKKEIFLRRVQNSLHNMELALEARAADMAKLYEEPTNFKAAEQGLMIGHNFHPYPKMREGFDDAEYAIYSPEMGGKFALHWFFVKPEVLHNQTAAQFKTKDWTSKLYVTEKAEISVPEGYLPFPVHPWQKNHLLKNKTIKQYVLDKKIIDAGGTSLMWYPTSSLRSIYAPHSPYMLKFSLTLKLTNSIRHLTDVEVVRGLQVYDVFATAKADEFKNRYPDFHVIFEPAFAAIKDENGKSIAESIVVCRENPFQDKEASGENIVLSTLAQDNPLGGETLIFKHILAKSQATGQSIHDVSREWFKKYLTIAIKPFITAQSEYGILLGAHQQNMVLTIKDHMPMKAYFRDCQGTGYSEHGFELYRHEVASLVKENGNILDEKGNILFGYYLLVNSTFNVISAIAHDNGVTEEVLVDDLRAFLKALLVPGLPDASFLNYCLARPEIYQKGNFNCSLQNLNENTAANPLAIYNLIKNPLYIPSEQGKSL